MEYDVLIIGGGPAGLTAGLYAARAGKKTGIVCGAFPGGAAALTATIENYSGHLSIDGYSLTDTMRRQAEQFGAEFLYAAAESMTLAGDQKTVRLDDGSELYAKYMILAMGTENRKLGLPNEDKLIGRGISYCATCDGNFFRGKTVVVNGGGDTAVTDALYLKNLAKEVYLVHRRQSFRAANVLVERLKASGVKLILDSVITGLNGEPLSSISVKKVTGEITEIPTDGLFVAIGTVPRTELVKGQVATDANGYILTDQEMQTDVPGVYAAGDVRVTPLRQVITACADGAIAANHISISDQSFFNLQKS